MIMKHTSIRITTMISTFSHTVITKHHQNSVYNNIIQSLFTIITLIRYIYLYNFIKTKQKYLNRHSLKNLILKNHSKSCINRLHIPFGRFSTTCSITEFISVNFLCISGWLGPNL